MQEIISSQYLGPAGQLALTLPDDDDGDDDDGGGGSSRRDDGDDDIYDDDDNDDEDYRNDYDDVVKTIQ